MLYSEIHQTLFFSQFLCFDKSFTDIENSSFIKDRSIDKLKSIEFRVNYLKNK